jgi:hypothetical protein
MGRNHTNEALSWEQVEGRQLLNGEEMLHNWTWRMQ